MVTVASLVSRNLSGKIVILTLTVGFTAGCAAELHHKTSADETMQLSAPSGTITPENRYD